MSDGFMVQTGALTWIAARIDDALIAVTAERDQFNAGPAVTNAGGDMLPDSASQEQYQQAIAGVQKQLDVLVASLEQWAQSFRDTATYYGDADILSENVILYGGGA